MNNNHCNNQMTTRLKSFQANKNDSYSIFMSQMNHIIKYKPCNSSSLDLYGNQALSLQDNYNYDSYLKYHQPKC